MQRYTAPIGAQVSHIGSKRRASRTFSHFTHTLFALSLKYQQVNAKNGHMKVQPLVMDAVGATNRVMERTADRIGYWLEAYLPMGTLNWAINTGPRYVRARLVIKVLRARARCLLRMRAVASPMGH